MGRDQHQRLTRGQPTQRAKGRSVPRLVRDASCVQLRQLSMIVPATARGPRNLRQFGVLAEKNVGRLVSHGRLLRTSARLDRETIFFHDAVENSDLWTVPSDGIVRR